MPQNRYEEKEKKTMKIILDCMKQFKSKKEILKILAKKKIKIHPKTLQRMEGRIRELSVLLQVEQVKQTSLQKPASGYKLIQQNWYFCIFCDFKTLNFGEIKKHVRMKHKTKLEFN